MPDDEDVPRRHVPTDKGRQDGCGGGQGRLLEDREKAFKVSSYLKGDVRATFDVATDAFDLVHQPSSDIEDLISRHATGPPVGIKKN